NKKPESNRPGTGQGQTGANTGTGQRNNRPGQGGQGNNQRPGNRTVTGGYQGGQRNDFRNRPSTARGHAPEQEIDTKAIQDKIREAQAKLSGGAARNNDLKAKYRRNKREEMAEKRAAAEQANDGSIIQVTEFISVSELANLLDVSFADI